MHKILLPVALPHTASRVVHQAALLARHFHSEIILLHVVTPLSYPAGVLESGHEIKAQNLHAKIVVQAQTDLEQSLRLELEGITVRRMLLKGDPAREIVRTARDEQVNLIAMATHSHGVLYRFLLGSVAAKMLHHSECPLWTDTYLDEVPAAAFAIRNVLCAVDLSAHSPHTASRAAQFAAEFSARLTLVHITPSVEIYGPGGSEVLPAWKKTLIDNAATQIAKLQEEVGIHAEVIIESGDVRPALNRAAEHAKSDLLIIGHLPSGGHLGANGAGYAVIRDSHIPVLSL